MFIAVIDGRGNKQIWSKIILSLAAISDQIKFIVSSSTLSISAVNSARTSHAEVELEQAFFHEYNADFSNIITEGFSSEEQTYSFLVNSKHLATLFRNLDANDLSYIVLKIYWEHDAPTSMKFKFLVEIKTKKLIVKKYQTNYQPVLLDRVQIADIYQRELDKQQDIEVDKSFLNRINVLSIELMIPKQFLDMIPSSTESFKIEVKNDKLSFSGYTRQILKDKEYLRQPMALTITMGLDEVPYNNLQGMPECRTCVSFRLKDFKNFMGLSSALNSTNQALKDNDMHEPQVEILFRNPGEPIIFKPQNTLNMKVRFVQITSEDTGEVTADSNISLKDLNLELRKPVIQKQKVSSVDIQKETEPTVDYISQLLEGQNSAHDIRPYSAHEIHTKRPIESHLNNRLEKHLLEPVEKQSTRPVKNLSTRPTENHSKRPFEDDETYEKRPKINVTYDENTDYSDSDEEEYLGPTQANTKPKSIFD